MGCDDFLTDVVAGQQNGSDAQNPGNPSPLAAHLASCPSCPKDSAEFRSTLDLLHVLPDLAPAPAVLDRLLHRIDSQPAPRRHPLHLVRHPRTLFWGKIAAGLLLAVALALTVEQFQRHNVGTVLARLVDQRSGDPLQGLTKVAATGMTWHDSGSCELHRGEGLVTQSGTTVRLELPGVGSLRTNGSGQFRLLDARRMDLSAGTLYFDIEPGKGGYDIATPAARVRVTGTRFWVRATRDWTAVLVLDGSVKLVNNTGLVDVPAFHRALARSTRPPTTPEKIPAVAENRINPFASLGPDPSLELITDTSPHPAGSPAPVRLRVSSESDDLWIEPYRDSSPYYLLSIQSGNDPPYTVRIAGAQGEPAIARQRPGEPQNVRRNEFYDVTFDLSGVLTAPGTYEISAILLSAGGGSTQTPIWVGVAQSAPVVVRITSR